MGNTVISLIAIIVLSYLVGSIPSSIIAGKVLRGIDIREHGSGNAGATNVFRVMGWKPGVAVAVIDMAKGFIATMFISRIVIGDIPVQYGLVQIIAGFAAVVGHIWTVFAGFKGGKGVLTVVGVFLGLTPGTMFVCMVVFAVVFLSTRYVSVGSLSAAAVLAITMIIRKFWLQDPVGMPLFIVSLVMTALIVFTHRNNIKRLIHGTENRFTWK